MNNPAVATLPVALNKPDVILVPVVVTPVPDTTNTLATPALLTRTVELEPILILLLPF